MGISEIVAEIDQNIATLQQARALLSGDAGLAGRSRNVISIGQEPAKKKRNLSPEGRKRIAEAVKRRWAKQKKAVAPAK